MSVAMDVCNEAMNTFKAVVKGTNFTFAYEKDIKNVPLSEYLCAVGVKKVVFGDRLMGKSETDGEVDLKKREVRVTISVNLYTPYSAGAEFAVNAFDDMAQALLESNWVETCGAKLLGTSYSRETQALITKTEFELVKFIMKPERVETI